MARGEKKESDPGVVSRLAGRGEDAVTRVMDELGRNPRVSDALAKAMSAKGKLDEASRAALAQAGLAAAEELKDLRNEIKKLEERLTRLERSRATARGPGAADRAKGAGTATPTAKRSETKSTPTTAKRTRRASREAGEAGPMPSATGESTAERASSSGGS